MKKVYIIANWKSHKTESEAKEWYRIFVDSLENTNIENKEIIICPPFILLPLLKSLITDSNSFIKLGAQDVSPFEQGAYTGEVNAAQIKEYADYVIIGHSERRNNFQEDDKLLEEKVKQANKANLSVIYCIQGKDTSVPENISLVAYEPVFAIGSGHPDTPENAEDVAQAKKQRYAYTLIYGGSVSPQNVAGFINMTNIEGVLVGTDCLKPEIFAEIVKNA